MPRTTSAGSILTDGKRFLVCHATGQKIWDLPKGKIDGEETALQAAIRELKEETNYDVPEDAVIEDAEELSDDDVEEVVDVEAVEPE